MVLEQTELSPAPETSQEVAQPIVHLSPSHSERFFKQIGLLKATDELASLPETNPALLSYLAGAYPIVESSRGLQLELTQSNLERMLNPTGLLHKMDQVFDPESAQRQIREVHGLITTLGQEVGNIIPDNPLFLLDRILSKLDDQGNLPESELPKLLQKKAQLEEMLPRLINFQPMLPTILEAAVQLQESPAYQGTEVGDELQFAMNHLTQAQTRFPVDIQRVQAALDRITNVKSA